MISTSRGIVSPGKAGVLHLCVSTISAMLRMRLRPWMAGFSMEGSSVSRWPAMDAPRAPIGVPLVVIAGAGKDYLPFEFLFIPPEGFDFHTKIRVENLSSDLETNAESFTQENLMICIDFESLTKRV